MKNAKQSNENTKAKQQPAPKQMPGKQQWVKPKMEDVSEEVMAQPYIRFT
jgi:hypothetical protein